MCGSGGSCTSDEAALGIGGGNPSYFSVTYSSETRGVAGCKAVCSSSSECAGFNYDRANGRCYFRRSTTCHTKSDFDRDCFTKSSELIVITAPMNIYFTHSLTHSLTHSPPLQPRPSARA